MTSATAIANVEQRYNRRAIRYDLVPGPMQVSERAIDICRAQVEAAGKARIRALMLPLVRRRTRAWEIGEGFHWAKGINVAGARLGRYVSVGTGTDIAGPVAVGDLTMLSSGIKLVGKDHVMDDPSRPMRAAFPATPRKVTVIEADCWIGHGAIILEGVSIGRGTVVASGAVVTKDTEPYCVVAGTPARQISTRFSDNDQRDYEAMLYG